MKHTSKFILMLSMIVFLASCGSISITSKRYSRGLNIGLYRVDEGKNPAPKKVRLPKQKTAETVVAGTESPVVVTEVQENVLIPDSRPEQAELKSVPTVVAAPALKHKRHFVNHESAMPMLAKKAGKIKLREMNSYVSSHSSATDSDVNIILLILLALFISPLAVFLYFDEANLHFWINLILWLGGIGLLGSLVFGIGLAIIHALLVIFGVFG